MTIGFDSYTGRAVAVQCMGEEREALTIEEQHALEFSNSMFEATDAGGGIIGDLESTASGGNVQIRFARLPSGFMGLTGAIGIMAPGVRLVVESPCTGGEDGDENECAYADCLVTFLDQLSHPETTDSDRETFALLWGLLNRMCGDDQFGNQRSKSTFATGVINKAWPRIRANTTSLSINIDHETGVAHCTHGFGSTRTAQDRDSYAHRRLLGSYYIGQTNYFSRHGNEA